MKAENLIGILIFLIFIVSVILKKARAGSKDGKAGAAKSQTGWKAKLDKYLAQIKQEMEASKKEGSDADTVWEELMQHEENPPEPAREEAYSVATKSVTEKTSTSRNTFASTEKRMRNNCFSSPVEQNFSSWQSGSI